MITGTKGQNKYGRKEIWTRFLQEEEKGKRLVDRMVDQGLVGNKRSGKQVCSMIVGYIESMYSNLNDLHHYQLSRTRVDIVEGPLTIQQCLRLECMAKVWGIEARVRRKDNLGSEVEFNSG
jgi:hypothetical protein